MSKVAFFVDGNFMFHQVTIFKSFYCDGPNTKKYCEKHLFMNESIYRIFFYDTPPLERKVISPSGIEIDFGETNAAKNMKKRISSIMETPYLALRLGKISFQNEWLLKPKALKEIIEKKRSVESITDEDYFPDIKQKAVDMKIGLDIATIAYKKLAERIVLIAGDADFAPAAKLARMEGLQVTLDSMGKKVSPDLLEHVDFMHTPLDPNNPEDVIVSQKPFFVAPQKPLMYANR
jgi:uncharacterized LabA/DUF88 family protein